MPDNRIQTWRQRQRVVARMIDCAFNGDAPDEAGQVEFALITMMPNGDISMIKNIDDPVLYAAFLKIISMHREEPVNDNSDEVVGHA